MCFTSFLLRWYWWSYHKLVAFNWACIAPWPYPSSTSFVHHVVHVSINHHPGDSYGSSVMTVHLVCFVLGSKFSKVSCMHRDTTCDKYCISLLNVLLLLICSLIVLKSTDQYTELDFWIIYFHVLAMLSFFLSFYPAKNVHCIFHNLALSRSFLPIYSPILGWIILKNF